MVTRIVPDTHATIAAALAASGAGDTVQIRTGTYAEGDLTQAASGIIVEAHPDNVADVRIAPPGGTSNGFRWFTDWTIRGHASSRIRILGASGAALTSSGAARDGVTVQFCDVVTCGGIGIGPMGTLCVVDRCRVSGAGANGITVAVGKSGTVIRNCEVRDTTGRGIIVIGAGSRAVHCTVARSSVHGIDRQTGAAVTNCAVWSSGNTGVLGTNANVTYTLAWLSGTVNFDAPAGVGCIEVDPQFSDAAANDFTPAGTASPLVDAGVNAAITASLNGATRPEGPGYDIGCYELVQAAPRGVLRAWCPEPREVRVVLSHPPAQYGPHSCLTRAAWTLSLASGETRRHGLPTLTGATEVAIPIDVPWPRADVITVTVTGTDDLGFVYDTPASVSCATLPEVNSTLAAERRFLPREDLATVEDTGALAQAGGTYGRHWGAAQMRKVVLRLLLDRPPRGLGLQSRKGSRLTPAQLSEVGAKAREIALAQSGALAARVTVTQDRASGVLRLEVAIRTPQGWETLSPVEV